MPTKIIVRPAFRPSAKDALIQVRELPRPRNTGESDCDCCEPGCDCEGCGCC